LVDLVEQERCVDAGAAAGLGKRKGAAAAEIDAVLFEDADGGRKSGSDLSDGAFRSGCCHDSIVAGVGREVGDWSHPDASRGGIFVLQLRCRQWVIVG
jgi:hypothetical protein